MAVRVLGAQGRERHAVRGMCANVFGGVARSPVTREEAVVGAAWCLEQAVTAWAPSQGASRDGRARAGCTAPRATRGARGVRECLQRGNVVKDDVGSAVPYFIQLRLSRL